MLRGLPFKVTEEEIHDFFAGIAIVDIQVLDSTNYMGVSGICGLLVVDYKQACQGIILVSNISPLQ